MKTKKYQCPDCHGSGGEKDVILDDGTGPWEECGFCKGTGEVHRKLFFKILGYKRAESKGAIKKSNPTLHRTRHGKACG